MSRFLRDILGNKNPLFTRYITEMERSAGEAIASKTIGEVLERSHAVMRRIGVATANTNAEELYYALCAAASNDDDIEDLLKRTSWSLLPFVDGPVSFNLQDVVDNAHHEIPFSSRRVSHGQRQLRRELTRRFSDHKRTYTPRIVNMAKDIGLNLKNDKDFRDLAAELPKRVDLNSTSKPSILAVGDVFTDAFIKLSEDSTKIITEKDGSEWLALPFGQKPPYDQVDIVRSVGPSPNVAVSAARLGLDAHLMAWVGDDAVGEEAIDYLCQEGVDVDAIVTEKGKMTSYWYVLRYGADRTMLVKSEKYKYKWKSPKRVPDWIYLSYTGEDSWPLHEEALEYLEKHKNVKLAFQPGTFHFKWGTKKLKKIYARSYITIMNREEAMDVTGEGYDDIKKLADALHALGPEIAVITDGGKGSYASFDGKLVTIPNYPDPAPPLDRTGAGDAFASTIVSALALGKTMEEALTWAPINSMNVVQHIGAQKGLLTLPQIKKHLKDAPNNYKVTDL